MWGLPDRDMCGLPDLWKSGLTEGSRIGGNDWFSGPRYDGFDVGGGRLIPGIMTDGMVGVVIGVAPGVKGCNSPPVSSDSG